MEICCQLDSLITASTNACVSSLKWRYKSVTLPEVVDCWLMTGNHDYLLRVVTRDIEDFEKFLVGQLTKIGGISSIESSIPLRCVKSGHARYR